MKQASRRKHTRNSNNLERNDRRTVLLSLCDILMIEGIDSAKVTSALQTKEFSDFEDCLQDECAIAIGADYIVTRNLKDFKNSTVAAISSREFLEILTEYGIQCQSREKAFPYLLFMHRGARGS